MNTTDAGRLGEAKVLARLAELGWYPFTDLSGKCPVDIVAWKDGETRTIQVKTATTKTASGKYTAYIGGIRPNRTGNVVKKFDKDAQDYLAVYVVPSDRVVFVESSTIAAMRELTIDASEVTVLS